MTTQTGSGDSPGGAGSEPAARVSQYARGSLANMARSLLVIVALLAALVALVPRSDLMSRPEVDAGSVVAQAVKDSGTAFEAPVGLESGWRPISARYAASTDGLRTWQAVWNTPSGSSISLKQTVGATPAWIAVATNQGTAAGEVELGGRSWERSEDARGQVSLVAASPAGLTTVITGAGDLDEIGRFVAALGPAPAAR